MSATEASRSFAAVLNEAEKGHTIVLTRGGRRIAVIGPAPASNGTAVVALLRAGVPDVAFAVDVQAARTAVTLDGPRWPVD